MPACRLLLFMAVMQAVLVCDGCRAIANMFSVGADALFVVIVAKSAAFLHSGVARVI
jgi:hypothetical protein